MKLRDVRQVTAWQVQEMFSGQYGQGSRVPLASQKLFDEGFPLRIVEHREVNCPAELHLHEDDLFQCLHGQATFIVGGRLVNPRWHDGSTCLGDAIEGGQTVALGPGDFLHVPAGQPHQPTTAGRARLTIVKVQSQEGQVELDYLPDR